MSTNRYCIGVLVLFLVLGIAFAGPGKRSPVPKALDATIDAAPRGPRSGRLVERAEPENPTPPQPFATLVSEGFNGTTFPPTGWSQDNGSYPWARQTATVYPSGYAPYEGAGIAEYDNYNYPTGNECRLIAPAFNPNGEQAIVEFAFFKCTYADYGDRLYLEYQVDGGGWVIVDTLIPYGASSNGWTMQQYVLPSLTGSVEVAFRGYSNYGYGNTYIDAVNVYTPNADDMAAVAIRTPAGAGLPTDTTFCPVVKIENKGTASQYDIPVHVWIDSAGTRLYDEMETFADTLDQGDTALVTFATAFTTAANKHVAYDMTAFTDLAGDEDNGNDTTVCSFATTADYNRCYAHVWSFNCHGHTAVVGVTPVQDTLIWVSSAGITSSSDTNYILIFDARTHAFIDSFPQAATSTWGYRDMAYDPVADLVYAGTDGNRLDAINPNTHVVVDSNTVAGAQTPGTVRALAFDGDSLYSANFSNSPVCKFATDGSNSHQVGPAPAHAAYGMAYDTTGGLVHLSEAPGADPKLAQYDAFSWVVLGDTVLPEFASSMGGCELWHGDTFLLVIDQELDNVVCYRVTPLEHDVGVTAYDLSLIHI